MLQITRGAGKVLTLEENGNVVSTTLKPRMIARGDMVVIEFTAAKTVYCREMPYTEVEVDGIIHTSATEAISEIEVLCADFSEGGGAGSGGTGGGTAEINALIAQHNSSALAHAAIRARITSLEQLGVWVDSFDTKALIPTNSSAFPNGITVNDFVNVREDETRGGAVTRYICTNIAGDGTLTWAFDLEFSTDITGKLDKVTDANTLHRAYAVAPNGSQEMLNVVTSPVAGSLPAYGSNGTLETETPVVNKDAANKLYVDNKIVFANKASFPATGIATSLYIAIDTNSVWRWDGTSYVQIGGGDQLVFLPKASFPATGEAGKLYIDTTDNSIYRWNGTIYVQLGGKELVFATKASFPATGESGMLYIATDTNTIWRWNGTEYIQLNEDELLFSTKSAFPATGKSGKLYIATDTNEIWRWDSALLPVAGYVLLGGKELVFDTKSSFPAIGEAKTLYIATDTNLIYRWDAALLPTPDYVQVAGVVSAVIPNGSDFNLLIKSGTYRGVNMASWLTMLHRPDAAYNTTLGYWFNCQVSLASDGIIVQRIEMVRPDDPNIIYERASQDATGTVWDSWDIGVARPYFETRMLRVKDTRTAPPIPVTKTMANIAVGDIISQIDFAGGYNQLYDPSASATATSRKFIATGDTTGVTITVEHVVYNTPIPPQGVTVTVKGISKIIVSSPGPNPIVVWSGQTLLTVFDMLGEQTATVTQNDFSGLTNTVSANTQINTLQAGQQLEGIADIDKAVVRDLTIPVGAKAFVPTKPDWDNSNFPASTAYADFGDPRGMEFDPVTGKLALQIGHWDNPDRDLEVDLSNLGKGVAGTYTQGVDFDGAGLPTFQEWLDANVNNRWFDGNIEIILNTANATDNILIHDVQSITAEIYSQPWFLDIKSSAQVANTLSLRDIGMFMRLYHSDLGTYCDRLDILSVRRVQIGTGTYNLNVLRNYLNGVVILNSDCIINTTYSFNAEIGSFTAISGTVNTATLLVTGTLIVRPTGVVNYTDLININGGMIIDTRPNHPLETYARDASGITDISFADFQLLTPQEKAGKHFSVYDDPKDMEGGTQIAFVPDYANMGSANLLPTASTVATIAADGFIRISSNVINGYCHLYINEQIMYGNYSQNIATVGQANVLPVKQGDVIRATVENVTALDVRFIPPVAVVPPSVNLNYSTTETNTGKKWIDGKDIYRCVFQWTSAAAINTYSYSDALAGVIETPVSLSGFITSTSGSRVPLLFIGAIQGVADIVCAFISSTGRINVAHTSASYNSRPVNIIVEYTKV